MNYHTVSFIFMYCRLGRIV